MIRLIKDIKQVKSLFDLLVIQALPGESGPICQRGEGGVKAECLGTSGCKSASFCSMYDITAHAAFLPEVFLTLSETLIPQKQCSNPPMTALLLCYRLSVHPFSNGHLQQRGQNHFIISQIQTGFSTLLYQFMQKMESTHTQYISIQFLFC